ncbi:GNAT family N-acetyltransferase [Thaumasiovibrio subtropicus]|uniref:GNAT family N-acetyltransferase n=1 Tax=Thaumasiovibrio subtropicus TaxID=1891207 RepID=UPI000B35FF30|nr:GNAT family N-acetyltransferase [Thaumasiovibrio subtropicus]
MFNYRPVTPTHSDFIRLSGELNEVLSNITGDSGERSFSAQDFNPSRDRYIVIYDQSTPIGCGGFRYHEKGICELKRMYSKRKGGGAYLLTALETLAVNRGYQTAILSTRRINHSAVEFYLRYGYIPSPPYGKYQHVDHSVCLQKQLTV